MVFFWTLETLAVPKSTFFPDELAYRRQVFKNEGTYIGGIEIGQLPYMRLRDKRGAGGGPS